jgi:hypothetical protein
MLRKWRANRIRVKISSLEKEAEYLEWKIINLTPKLCHDFYRLTDVKADIAGLEERLRQIEGDKNA